MLPLVLDAIVIIAALVWSGGLLALGAIVAPTVFGSGDPHAADVMTLVFSRFDRVAVACAAVILVGEAISIAARRPTRAVTTALAAVLAACAAIQAWYLTPTIVSLYEHGILRGTPRFDRIHHASESLGKFTVVAALAFAVSVLATRRREARSEEVVP